MADIIMPSVPSSIPCGFKQAWVGKCNKSSTNGWCTEHEKLVCIVCGKKATRTCEYTGSSPTVCGRPLCDSCEHEPYDAISAPFPSRHLNAKQFSEACRLAKYDEEVE